MLCVKNIHLATISHQLLHTSLVILLLLLFIRTLYLFGQLFVLLLFRHFAEFCRSLVRFATKLRIRRIESWNVLKQLLSSLVSVIELLLVAARVANGIDVFILDFESTLWVFALSAQDVFLDEPN